MHLILDYNSIFLSIDNNCLSVRKDEQARTIAASRIDAIHILTPCTLTTPVLSWACDHEIALLVYDKKGRVVSRVWQPHFGSHAAIRIQQVAFCASAEGLMWIKEMLYRKASHQLNTHLSIPAALRDEGCTKKLQQYTGRFRTDSGINLLWLRGMEAACSRWYWIGIVHALKKHVEILPRNFRPARDKFNSLLNYLYGTLYGLVEGSLIAAGLDPHISVMHRMEYNTPAFVFDMIEPFRHWADDYLIHRVLNHGISETMLENKGGNFILSAQGKKEILSGWFVYLDEKTPSPKKMVRRRDQVQQLCTSLASKLLTQYNANKYKEP